MKTRTQLLIGCIASALLSVSALATTNNAFSIGIRFAPTEVSGGGQATMAPTDIAGVTPVVQGNWNNAFGDDQANATTELRDIKGTLANLVADNNGVSNATTATVTWGNADS